ncbi:HemY protein [Oceanospirillum multiglobuliferum]|uniref:HemY N-terminal domain-containing protein n=1 Tax=Oceanospirillum multiglobuliferum TaxID=64969 RepID=A0A1T4NP87_9GAMM|nr:heme biosynthesis HemY N-terminal domain-containing protein [Oceanospirillum multiglobuliferum]OPX55734.1 hypothetical protein BTE48_07535 [Oceanospirillum multiglobuliferum]SJZ80856.1 HemY protein [Oceanospirillum multiglobuliferum]
MKVLYIAAVLALTTGIFAGLLMQQDPGYVLFSWGNTTVEMSLWVALILIFTLVVGVHLLLRLLSGIRQPLKVLNLFSAGNKDKRALKATVSGLLLLAEGQWRKSERLLKKSALRSGAPLINYLAAARAAHAQGHNEQTDLMLQKALESTPSAETAVAISQAEFQYERGQYEQCLASLLRLQKKNPKHRWVLKTLLKVYQKLGDWQALQTLYPQLLRYKVLTEAEGQQLQLKLYSELFQQGAQLAKEERISLLQNIWQKMPSELKSNEMLSEAYARALHASGAEGALEKFIAEKLRHQWSDNLVVIYGLLGSGTDSKKLLAQAEQWLKQYGDKPVLHLTLGRLSIRNQLWGKGADYLEASYKLQPMATTAAELSRLYSSMGRTSKSRFYYQACLDLAGYHLPELPMPKDAH